MIQTMDVVRSADRESADREDAPFRPEPMVAIRVPKMAELIADHFRRRIIMGELKEGDHLPPEGQLMTALSISRPTLREAFRILEMERLISVVRGSRAGAQVHQPKVDIVSRYARFVLQASGTTIADIYEARLAIEPYAARRLAEMRPPGAVDRLRAEVARIRGMIENDRQADFRVGLAEFHRLLVELVGNNTLHFLIQILHEVVAFYQVRHLQMNPVSTDGTRRALVLGLRSFDKLIDLIEAGDADGAQAHWLLHVTNANKIWASNQELRAILDGQD